MVKYGKIQPIWEGGAAYLIGGGPSLKGFDWNKLKGKRVIAINRAHEVVPDADVLYWTDAQFYRWYQKEIEAFKGLKVASKPCGTDKSDIIVLRGLNTRSIDLRPGYICHGNNSGYGAINLAMKLGAKRIYLLGYDMSSDVGATHWHNGYARKHNHNIYKRLFAYFEALKNMLPQLEVEVWNANPDSRLNVLQKCTLESALLDQPRTVAN